MRRADSTSPAPRPGTLSAAPPSSTPAHASSECPLQSCGDLLKNSNSRIWLMRSIISCSSWFSNSMSTFQENIREIPRRYCRDTRVIPGQYCGGYIVKWTRSVGKRKENFMMSGAYGEEACLDHSCPRIHRRGASACHGGSSPWGSRGCDAWGWRWAAPRSRSHPCLRWFSETAASLPPPRCSPGCPAQNHGVTLNQSDHHWILRQARATASTLGTLHKASRGVYYVHFSYNIRWYVHFWYWCYTRMILWHPDDTKPL